MPDKKELRQDIKKLIAERDESVEKLDESTDRLDKNVKRNCFHFTIWSDLNPKRAKGRA